MDTLDLARHFVATLESGDAEAVRACYAEGALIWHNFDDESQTVDQNLAIFEWMKRVTTKRRYDVQRLEEIPGGYLQQHVLRLVDREGREHAVPACVIVSVEHGKIRRIEEYLDPAPVAGLR